MAGEEGLMVPTFSMYSDSVRPSECFCALLESDTLRCCDGGFGCRFIVVDGWKRYEEFDISFLEDWAFTFYNSRDVAAVDLEITAALILKSRWLLQRFLGIHIDLWRSTV